MLSAILRDPFRRSRLFTLLTALFAFLWPLLGAAPILALWLVHVVLLFRGTPCRGLRVFYGAVAALAALIFLLFRRGYLPEGEQRRLSSVSAAATSVK